MAKMTKKEIYARYGVEYDTKTGKILSPIGWINPVLVNGNSKLGVGVYTFSTLPTNAMYHVTIFGIEYNIKGTCPCSCDGCYATKGFYNMPSTIISNALKTLLAREYIGFLENAIKAQIEADKILLLRIHASGDFFSEEYIEMWKRIVSHAMGAVFWTYTKNKTAELAFVGLQNINIVSSIVPGFGFNFGHCDYILRVFKALKELGKPVYICRCGIDRNQHCTNCKGCSVNKYVLFIEHSTDYKAEEDPMFEELKRVIEAQGIC